MIGELLSWIGLSLGIPLLLLAFVLKLAVGAAIPIEIVLVDRSGVAIARWFTSGGFHERPLRPWELDRVRGHDAYPAFTSSRNASRMRLDEHHPIVRTAFTLGLVLTIVGAIGFAASWTPTIVG